MSEAAQMLATPQAASRRTSSTGLIVAVTLTLAASLVLALAVDEKFAWLAALGVVGPIALHYIMSRPLVAVGVALASHAWASDTGSQYLTPFKFAGAVAMLVVGRDVITRGRVATMPRVFAWGLGALLALVATGELAAEFEGSLGPFFEFAGTLIVFAMLSQVVQRMSDIRTLAIIYTVNLALTFFSVWREVGWAGLGEAGTRAGGSCGHPNALGNHLAMSLPFALAVILDRAERTWLRLVAVFAALGAVYGEWAAASRGGTIGFGFALLGFAMIAPPRTSFRVAAIALAIAIGATATAVAPKSFTRVTETFDGTNDLETSSSERALHARLSAEMMPRHPYLGAGITAFGYERSRYSGALGGGLHSSVLSVAVAYGLPAVTLYILLQLSSVWVTLKTLGTGRQRLYFAALAAAAMAAISSSLSGTELFRTEQWGVLGLCHIAALRRLTNARFDLEDPASS